MPKIRLTVSRAAQVGENIVSQPAGTEIECTQAEADRLIAAGHASEIDGKPAKTEAKASKSDAENPKTEAKTEAKTVENTPKPAEKPAQKAEKSAVSTAKPSPTGPKKPGKPTPKPATA